MSDPTPTDAERVIWARVADEIDATEPKRHPEGGTTMTDDHQGARGDARKRTAQGVPGVTLTECEREALGRSVAAVINRHSWDAAAETADFDMADAILDDNHAASSVGLVLTVERIIAARLAEAEQAAEQRERERVLTAVEALAERWHDYGRTAPTDLDQRRWWSVEGSLRALVAQQREARP